MDETHITTLLENVGPVDGVRLREILARASAMRGLDLPDVAALMAVEDPLLLEEVFAAARELKEEIYGNRLVMFAPLYLSNLCRNECLYCAFRARNQDVVRRVLTQEEIAEEVRALIDSGHKRLLVVSGESWPAEGFSYLLKSIETIYGVKSGRGEIRRVNVNVAPLSVSEFRQLHAAQIGTYQVFQETYHRETYARVHVAGTKRDFDWRVTAPDRAMQAGIDDIGVGVLYGLYDWKFDTLSLLQHVQHLEQTFGVGPHTISVPRLEPAVGSELAAHPQHAVSDAEFMRLVAILRLAVPYTGIIMSTRESANTRRATFELGVSQISAGSRTNPGGYCEGKPVENLEQFQLGDHRTLDEVVADVASLGYTPSFCTACYRMGRTGRDFMDLAKPGLIKHHCGPNAMSSFLEYLSDYATPETKNCGEQRIACQLDQMEGSCLRITRRLLDSVRTGERDVFV